MAQASPLVAALNRELRKYPSLDPRAVLAIASHEGLSGGIGDNGTSYGPFQLHKGGAYPSSAPQNPSAANAWAWSPQGIDYALNQIQGVARGLHGLPAITAISTRFERPANPQAEILDAARHYGLAAVGGMAPAGVTAPPHAPAAAPSRQAQVLQAAHSQAMQRLASALSNTFRAVGLSPIPGLAGALSR